MVGFTLQPRGPGLVAINLWYNQVPRSGRTRLAQPGRCVRLPSPSPSGSSKIHLFGILVPKAHQGAGEEGLGDEHRLLGGGLEIISKERKGAALLRGERGDRLEIGLFYRTAAPVMN